MCKVTLQFQFTLYQIKRSEEGIENIKKKKKIGKTDLNELFLLIIVIFYLLGFRAYNLFAVTLFYGHWIGK